MASIGRTPPATATATATGPSLSGSNKASRWGEKIFRYEMGHSGFECGRKGDWTGIPKSRAVGHQCDMYSIQAETRANVTSGGFEAAELVHVPRHLCLTNLSRLTFSDQPSSQPSSAPDRAKVRD